LRPLVWRSLCSLGHTAVWVKDDSTHTDVVFNYGFFDSSQPNFIYHFVRGETDYVLGVTSFKILFRNIEDKGVSVWEQPLNLSQGEKQTLWKALYINSLPENRSYRYNFLYDNCATRPRDMVEKYVEGKIIYPKTTDNQTYRNLLHECLHPYPWMEFGIDLIIGAPADRKIDERDKMFLPEYLMRAFEGAIVEKNDTLRYPLVQQTRVILTSNNAAKVSEHSIFTPLNMAFVIVINHTVTFYYTSK